MGRSGTTSTVKGTKGNDPNLRLPDGVPIIEVQVDGGTGSDTLNLSNYGSGVYVALVDGYAKSSSTVSDKDFTGIWVNSTNAGSVTVKGTMKNVENLIGTGYNDFLFINIRDTVKFIDGGGGNDVVNSLGGNATLVGGTGNDWLVGYWQNVILVGGTWNGVTATGDGQTDYFYSGSQNPTILDFEIAHDRLICEFASTSIELGQWVDNGSGGATLMVNGLAEVTLANVDVATAQSIEIGYALYSNSGVIEGSSGDDLIWAGGNTATRIILGASNGDDALVDFNIANDILVFEDDVVPLWSDTLVNGASALVGTWADGSVTIQGLGTDDLGNLLIEGVATPPAIGPSGASAWSTDSDYPDLLGGGG